MYIHTAEGSACPQYTCVQVTTPVAITTEPPVTCPPMELPICKADEELYQINPNELCPRFGCKPFGMTPTPLPEAPRNITPTCNVDGRTFDSFDDSHYQIEPCNHILAEDKINKNWVISMHRNCSFSDSCDRYLKIMQNDQQLILKPDLLIVWDENSYTVSQAQRIGSSQNTFTVSRVGDSIRFSSTVYKFNVEWNTEMNVRIELDAELQNRVDGLCGFYTGYDHDDKTKPDGKLAATMKDYGQSWALDDQPCEEKPKCSVTQSAESFRLCEAIRNDPFTKCHSSVDPSVFMKGCVASTCDCLREGKGEEECRCQALTHYVTRCLETDSTIKLDDWRIVAKCYKECGPGERYQDCFRATCEKSCENLHDDTACLEREGSCVPGCFCSPGLVRKGERCVNPEKCGDCVCEGYGDPHYQTFDRQNYTFNGECSYVAARDKNVRGQHAFQVITRNKQCTVQPVTVCTDAVTVLYKDHTVFIEALGEDSVSVTVDGENIPTFPYRDSWLALEQPDPMQVMAAISEIQLEVNFFLENYGFSVKVPSRLYFNKTEGLCGNCNFKDDDDFVAQGTGLVESSDVFGRSWLLEGEPSTCGVLEKDTTSCIPLPPDEDPCLRIMDENLFGKCHPVEDPVPYVSSCIMDACGSREPEVAACHSLEAYARRCAELDICLKWRSDNLCPKTCPDTLEFRPCGPGCVRTCENFEELNANPDACPISPVDGCFCPDGMVLDNGACINETFCTTCDNEGHRIGDSWKTDPCTTCECTMRGSVCSTKACPDDPICDEGYEVVEVPGTGDDCCGPRKKCRVVPTEDCPPVVKPKEECGYGQRHKLIEAPGVCPQYACVCVESKDCPDVELPKDSDLKPGEEWILDDSGCCPRYKTECTDLCPEIECPEFYEPVEKPLLSGQCCPEVECEPPTDACIYENIYIVDATGFQKSVALPTATKKGGRPQLPEPEKKLYKVGESWEDGLCLKCQCTLDSTSKPRHTCTEQTCPTIDTHPDRGQFQLDSLLVPGQCCPDIVRTACIDDYEVIAIGDRLDDPFNGCRSVECVRNPEGKVDKVEQIHTCDENCPLGWEYEPSPLYPQVCCGECVQVACVVDGEVKNVGETWVSDDFCTTFTCSKDSGSQIQIQAVEAQCSEPSAKDRENYVYEEKRMPGQCCALYTRTACLMDGVPVQAGESVQDPLDNCLTVTCDLASDGNVTRREKETTCDTECALGQTFIEPIEGSNDCCGKCLVTHCVDDGIAHPIGERWESESDICYEYSCETRDDVLTTVAVKKDCPYFDPECPPNEIYMDEKGCCQLCNVTRPVKSDCKPNPMPLVDTVGIFTLAARSVGTCKNPDPVPGFNTCSGHCDSFTTFVAGRRAGHIPTCYCCKPARFEKIRVDMRCDTGYAFARVYDNIVECECLRCDDNTPDYMGDEPILDDAEFFAITAEPTDV